MASTPKDLTGNRYGRLLANKRMEMSPNAGYFWNCSCDCGGIVKVTIGNLNSGHTKSCGCLIVDVMKEIKTTHGMTRTREYKSWIKVRERCLDEKDIEYKNYGAIGITIQDSWKNDFSAFLSYIGKHPDYNTKYTIDRIDNNKGYEEGNVRWADKYQQARNKGMFDSNTSGVTGVCWDLKTNGVWSNTYAKAQWHDFVKIRSKVFSIKKHGLMPAFLMACNYRDKMIAELNKQGAGYSASHGL
jgi:hypothetical protein